MEYQDLTIDLRSAEGGGFEASFVETPLRYTPPVRFGEPVERSTLDLLLASFDGPEDKVEKQIKELPISPRKIGEQVFARLFKDGLGDQFRSRREDIYRAGKEGLRLRLRFRIDDPQADYLAAVPWERLYDSHASRYLATDDLMSVVREIVAPIPRPPLVLEPPLRILVVDAAPSAMKKLNLKLEINRMARALSGLQKDGQVKLFRLLQPTKLEMREALLDEEIHILHFMGHGGYDPKSGYGAVSFEDDDGTEDQVGGEELASYLNQRRASLRLVVLNACKTARHAGHIAAPLNHGVASAILAQTGIPAVVANQYSISDAAAIAFSKIFYGRLAAGDGVDEAMTEVRLRLWKSSNEWATPVLFLTAPHGRIFTMTTDHRRSAVREVSPQTEDGPVRLGVRSFDGWGQDMDLRNDEVLDLVRYFDDRYIRDKASWQTKVFTRLRTFLDRSVVERRPLLLDFAAHSSIAFAAGWLLKPKSGLDVTVRQRTSLEGEREWHPKDGSEPEGILWCKPCDIGLDPRAPDIAVALAVSQPNVIEHVHEFVVSKKLPVGRILDATIYPKPDGGSVQGGEHSLRLAQALLPRLQARYPHERGGRVHLFCAAPNALVFYLGQLASSLGKIVLYEFAFDAEHSFGRYQQSIELPPPGEARRLAEDW